MSDEIKVSEPFQRVDEVSNPQTATAETVKGDTVNLTGNVRAVQARQVNVKNGGIGAAKGEAFTVTVTNGGIAAMAANHADVTVNGGGIAAMAAREATVRNTNIGALAALKVSGDAKVLFDLRAGLLAGVVAGTVFGLISYVQRRGRR